MYSGIIFILPFQWIYRLFISLNMKITPAWCEKIDQLLIHYQPQNEMLKRKKKISFLFGWIPLTLIMGSVDNILILLNRFMAKDLTDNWLLSIVLIVKSSMIHASAQDLWITADLNCLHNSLSPHKTGEKCWTSYGDVYCRMKNVFTGQSHSNQFN